MDWDSDNAILGEHNLNNVFAFESKPTTVVRLLDTDKVRARWHSHVQNRELNLVNSNDESLSGAHSIIFRGKRRMGQLASSGESPVWCPR